MQTIAETLKKSTYDLSFLLDNLLEWAKIQRGGINPQPEKLPLADIVHSCLEKMRESAAEKNIVMSSDIKEATFVSADRNMIRSVIHNLLLNAIKFTAAGGAVKIVSFSREKFVEISVSDTGVGIREDRLKKIFHINGHITTPGTKGEAGSGLGLILSKEFVEKNGGRISIESTLGQGTTVRFTLPAAP